jgi:kynureninase
VHEECNLICFFSECQVDVVTSSDLARRGNQISLHFKTHSLSEIHDYMSARGVVVDVRGPLMRVALAPLYNSFSDVLKFYCILKQAVSKMHIV